MGEEHLDPLAIAARLLKGPSVGKCSGHIARILVDAARDFALRGFRTASRLQRARAAVRYPCAVKQRRSIMNAPCRAQQFARRADIDVALLIEREVFPAQRTVLPPRHVLNWNMRRDILLIDDPIERFG